jgi:aminoglycoside 2'-N-acetyltransferase I
MRAKVAARAAGSGKQSGISPGVTPPDTAADGVEIIVGHTASLSDDLLERARRLLYVVFDDMTEHDWEHSLGGMHAIAVVADVVIGHAAVIQRRLLHLGRSIRTGYVEGVGVDPDWQRRGIGSRLMEPLENIIGHAYDLGALGASDEGIPFYLARGWQRWNGATSVITPAGIVGTPEDDGGVFVFAAGEKMQLGGELSCDWRCGDVW